MRSSATRWWPQVLADTAMLIAEGARVLSDLATLRDQGAIDLRIFGRREDPTPAPSCR